MKRQVLALTMVLALLTLTLVGIQSIKAESQTERPLFFSGIDIVSPSNGTCSSNLLTLNVTSKALQGININIVMNYSIDGECRGIIATTTKMEPILATITYANGTTTTGPSIQSPNVTRGYVTLPNFSEGTHYITVYAQYDYPNTNRFVTPYPGTITYFENSTVYFTVDLNPTSSPNISILSIANKTYDSKSTQLEFSIDKAWSNMAYSLNNQANITISGNTTLTDLAEGSNSLVVYATDSVGNTGKSDIVFFAVNTPTPSPTPTQSQNPAPSISPSPSIPEFPSGIILLLAMIALTLAIVVANRKRSK